MATLTCLDCRHHQSTTYGKDTKTVVCRFSRNNSALHVFKLGTPACGLIYPKDSKKN